jgi:predicted DNA-binding transcriptional regulator YafY
VRDRVVDLPQRYAVEAVVEAPAGVVRSRISRWATVEDDGPARCRVLIDADNLDWPATALAMTGAGFTVLSPPELRDHLRDMGRRCAAAADPVGT